VRRAVAALDRNNLDRLLSRCRTEVRDDRTHGRTVYDPRHHYSASGGAAQLSGDVDVP